MRNSLRILLVLGVLLLAACVSTVPTKVEPAADIYVAPASPLPVDGAELETVSFAKVLIQIPPGTPMGRAVISGRAGREIPYNGDGIQEASVNYTMMALEELRQAGYRVLGGESLLFAQDESGKARYTIGGTIRKIYIVVYGDFWWGVPQNAPVECGMEVEWQLFDTRARKVAYTFSTRGYHQSNGTVPQGIQGSFREAFRQLLANRDFSAQLLAANKPGANFSDLPPLKIARPATPATTLPKDIPQVTQAVFTVKSGGVHGTGFFISPDGHALTAAHVVSGLDKVIVRLAHGLELEAAVIRLDLRHDVAVLKVAGSGFPSLAPAGDTPASGAEIYAIGTPLALELHNSVSRGVVSGLRTLEGIEAVQTDASINPGSSGGPLLNTDGAVVGIISSKMAGLGLEGLAFAVPIELTKRILNLNYD